MRYSKEYPRVIFNIKSLEKLIEEYNRSVKDITKNKYYLLKVERNNEYWDYNNIEEFYADIRAPFSRISIRVDNEDLTLEFSIVNNKWTKQSNISLGSASRENIIKLVHALDSFEKECYIPEEETPKPRVKIFIGHGNDPLWKDLKNHLQDLHDLDAIAYETGSRAGHTIRDVIEEMLAQASFAVLVMTGEDKTDSGIIRTRQNVIHELGLFQGKLGFTKAIVLKEEGVEEFSNINGVQQIRFSKGNIRETFGDVLAAIKREFKK